MKIDFTYNAHDDKTNEVQYFDTDGNMVAKFSIADFLSWIEKNFDFEVDSKEEADYIDKNWVKLSTDFYNQKVQPYPFGHKQGFVNTKNK